MYDTVASVNYATKYDMQQSLDPQQSCQGKWPVVPRLDVVFVDT